MHIVISSLAMLLPISLIYQIKAIMSLLENGSLNTKIEIFFKLLSTLLMEISIFSRVKAAAISVILILTLVQ